MKKFIILGTLLFASSAIAGNILPLTPGTTTSNIMFNNVVALQVEKSHPVHKGIKKGKPSNKLESSDEFPSVDGYFEGPLPEVIFTGELEGGDGEGSGGDDIVEVGLFPEPVCACVGNIIVDYTLPDDQGATE
jgi:hypothetical protein